MRAKRPAHCLLLLLDGVAAPYRSLGEDGRQIVAFHVAGDLVDLTSLLLGRVDHSVAAVTPARVLPVPHATIQGWIERYPRLGQRLWQDTLIDAAVFREWVVNVGRRTPYWRTAHLLCELVARLRAAGLAQGEPCKLPVPCPALADALGLSPVHVNRALQELRDEGLIELRGEALVVLDWRGLKQAAGYDPAYLHQFAAAAA